MVRPPKSCSISSVDVSRKGGFRRRHRGAEAGRDVPQAEPEPGHHQPGLLVRGSAAAGSLHALLLQRAGLQRHLRQLAELRQRRRLHADAAADGPVPPGAGQAIRRQAQRRHGHHCCPVTCNGVSTTPPTYFVGPNPQKQQ